jgi:hypothetical protein
MKTETLLLKMVNACGVKWLLDEERVKNILHEMERVENIHGDMAEIGVFQGATSLLMKSYFPERTLHIYDTFSGIPNVDPETCKFKTGDFACPIESVKRVLGVDKVMYHVGIFPETFHEHQHRFSFVHSDTDTYAGTLATLNTMFPVLLPGGVIVLDDYTFSITPGVKIAVDAWLGDNRPKCKVREHIMQLVVTKL